MKTVRLTVAEACRKRGIGSAYQLQKALDLQPTQANRLYHGKVSSASFKTLELLINGLGVELTDLVAVEDEPPAPKKRTRKPRITSA